MPTFIVSRAQPEDVTLLKAIELECVLSPWTLDAYVSEQQRDDSIMLKAAESNGTIVGFILGRAPMGMEAEIYNIGTASESRRMGVGTLLMAEFRAICAQRRVSSIWLEVRQSNRSAIDFYSSHGFVPKGIRPNFYSEPTEGAELMSVSLG